MTSIRPMTPVSYQSGSGSDGGAMAGFAPAVVNLGKVGVLTRFGRTRDWLVDPGQVSRRHGSADELERGPADRPTSERPPEATKMLAFPPPVDYTSLVRSRPGAPEKAGAY